MATIKESLSLPQDISTFYWIDSITALYWIRNVKSWKQYVEHRVREIRQLSDKEQWRFCPGLQNPADLPSCGLDGKSLATNVTWWNGPEFLAHLEALWALDPINKEDPDKAVEEIVKNPPRITYCFANTTLSDVHSCKLEKIIKCGEYSSWSRLLRVTAYVLRFVGVLKKCKLRIKRGNIRNGSGRSPQLK